MFFSTDYMPCILIIVRFIFLTTRPWYFCIESNEKYFSSQIQVPVLNDFSLLKGVHNLNHSNVESTFIQSTRTQIFSKTIGALSCWYSFESSRRVLSYEYPFAGVSVIFQVFCIILYWPN